MTLAEHGQAAAPERTCVGCRARRAQAELLRFRLDGKALVPAMSRRAGPARVEGRSAYLCPRRACLDRAVKRRAFTRAFSSRKTARAVVSPTGDGLWAAAIEQLRREIELFERSAANPHAQTRRRGLERLLFELSSQPIPSDGRPHGQGGSPTHG